MNTETRLLQRNGIHEFEGLTIRKVIESPCGKRGYRVNYVFVFEDNSWAAISSVNDGEDTYSYVETNAWYITDLCAPRELFDAGLINQAQRELLEKREADAKAAANREKIARLQAEIEKLEKVAA